ncbi:MAG: hypothetical protein ACI9BN_000530 [Francisella sp.]|jgi:hypothetical protein
MKNIIIIASISISNAKYYVLDDLGKTIGTCNNLEIKEDSGQRFERAVFSDCLNNMVFSYGRDFHYRNTKS